MTEEISKETAEDIRLGGSPPFVTMLKLSIGPLSFAVINGIKDSMNLYMIRRGFGQKGSSIVSISSGLRTLCVSSSNFCLQGMTIKISELVSKHQHEKAGKLFVEAFRLAMILGIVIPGILGSSMYKLLPILGMPKEFLTDSMYYLLPVFATSFFMMMQAICDGVLNGMGKTSLASTFQISAILLSLSCDPLLIWGFKVDIRLMGVSYASGRFLISILTMILCFTGKVSIKPVWAAFKEKPSTEFWGMLRLCGPSVVSIFVSLICHMIVVAIVTKASKNIGLGKIIPTVFATSNKCYIITNACVGGFQGGFAPAATWAYHRNKESRFKKLSYYCVFLPYFILAVLWTLMVFKPTPVFKIWIEDKEMLSWVPKVAPIHFYSVILEPILHTLALLLVVIKKPLLGAIGLILRNGVIVGSCFILYHIFKKNPEYLIFSLSIQDVIYLIYLLIAFFCSYKKKKIQSIEKSQITESLLTDDTI